MIPNKAYVSLDQCSDVLDIWDGFWQWLVWQRFANLVQDPVTWNKWIIKQMHESPPSPPNHPPPPTTSTGEGYIHICIYTYIYVYTFTNKHTTYVYTCTCTCTHTHIYIYICMYVYIYIVAIYGTPARPMFSVDFAVSAPFPLKSGLVCLTFSSLDLFFWSQASPS